MTLRAILAKHHQPAGLAGSGSNAALERDLVRHARWNAISYAVLFALVVVILFSVGVIIILDANSGRGIRTNVLAGAGVSFPVILEVMRRTVREWSRADLLVVLSRRLDSAQLQTVIERLLE